MAVDHIDRWSGAHLGGGEWTAIVFAVIAAILFGPKIIYTAVERCIMGLVAIIVVGLIYVVWEIGSADLFGDMWRGLLNVGRFPDFPVEIPPVDGEARPPFAFSQFFGALVFAGLGGLGNLYYAYYLREKKVGMGQRMPPLMSPTHKHEVKEIDAGYVYPESEENHRRFRGGLYPKVTRPSGFLFLHIVEPSGFFNLPCLFYSLRQVANLGENIQKV